MVVLVTTQHSRNVLVAVHFIPWIKLCTPWTNWDQTIGVYGWCNASFCPVMGRKVSHSEQGGRYYNIIILISPFHELFNISLRNLYNLKQSSGNPTLNCQLLCFQRVFVFYCFSFLQGSKILMTEKDLNGTDRVAVEGMATEEECKMLIKLAEVCSLLNSFVCFYTACILL